MSPAAVGRDTLALLDNEEVRDCMPTPDHAPTVQRPPAWLRAANRALATAAGRKFLPTLDEATPLLAAAQRRTGLDDFGDPRFRLGLDALLQSLAETDLTPIGRLVVRDTLIGYLLNRLRIRASLAQHPDIAGQPVPRPLFIVGLSRTGTTLLHNLLALAPGARAPRTWELLAPAPPCQPGSRSERRRVTEARRRLRLLYVAAPDLRIVHPIGARDAEECYILLNHTFISPAFGMHFGVPGYWDWITSAPLDVVRHAYEEYRAQLQILQSGHAPNRWILKSAVHLLSLPTLLEVFPEAMIVQTHRDPLETLPSLCSMVACFRNLLYPERSPRELGRECLERAATALRSGRAAREGRPRDQFLDVAFDRLTRDPLGQVERIHSHFGLEWQAAHREAVRDWIATNPPQRHGVHCYSMTQFGLDPDTIAAALAPAPGDGR
jgi:hypothetical protein